MGKKKNNKPRRNQGVFDAVVLPWPAVAKDVPSSL